MVRKIVWTSVALRHLEEIAHYISAQAEPPEQLVISRILDAVEWRESYPSMGAIVPERNEDGIREIHVFQWRIIYLVWSIRIDVLDIICTADAWRG
jgi:plasmid stabilization system protein ParE